MAIVYSLNNSIVATASTRRVRGEPTVCSRDASAPATSRTGSRLAFVQENAGVVNLSVVVSTSTSWANRKVLRSALFASSRGTGEHPRFFGEEYLTQTSVSCNLLQVSLH